MTALARAGIAVYAACVDFMIHLANLLGVTYRDTNAGMFFLLWPAVTAALAIVVIAQQAAIVRRRAQAREERRSRREDPRT